MSQTLIDLLIPFGLWLIVIGIIFAVFSFPRVR